jgi:hypothetical protein
MFDRGRGVKCNGTGITGSGDFIRFKGLYAERRKNSTSGYSGSRYIGGCERVIDSDAVERMIAISKMLKRREPCHFIREYFGQMDRVYNLHNKAGVEAYIKSLHVI